MNRIAYEFFDGAAEITLFESGGSDEAEFSFPDSAEGLLSIGDIVGRVHGGVCRLDLRLIENGSYEPVLILKGGCVKLPTLEKSGRRIRPTDCTEKFVRDISLRERRLAMRVCALERELERICSKIYDTTIF